MFLKVSVPFQCTIDMYSPLLFLPMTYDMKNYKMLFDSFNKIKSKSISMDIIHQTGNLTRNIWTEIVLYSQSVKCKLEKKIPFSPTN